MRALARILVALAACAALGALVAAGTFSAPKDAEARPAAAAPALAGPATAVATAAKKKKPKKLVCKKPFKKVKKGKKFKCVRKPVAKPPPAPAPTPVPAPAPAPAPAPSPLPPPGPPVAAGLVHIADDASGAALFALSAMRPGATVERCVAVTYDGELAAHVRIHAAGAVGTLAGLLDVTVTPGTVTGPGCAGFAPRADGAWAGTMDELLADHADWGTGIEAPAPGATWSLGDRVVFRIAVTLRDDPAANGGALGPLATGAIALSWEARSD